MKRISVLAILTLAVSSWAQSLGDVARANRERPKPPTAKVVTNEDLKSDDGEKQSGTSGDLEQELDRMRSVFREICSDPKTEHGRKLSDYENQAIADRVKPLRARVDQFERIRKGFKEALAALDNEMQIEIKKAWPTGRPFTQADVQRVKTIREDYDARKSSLIKKGESELQGYLVLQKDLESVGAECPEAAKTIPD